MMNKKWWKRWERVKRIRGYYLINANFFNQKNPPIKSVKLLITNFQTKEYWNRKEEEKFKNKGKQMIIYYIITATNQK